MAWICHGQGFTKIYFFDRKANDTMIKLQVVIENRVGSGEKKVLYLKKGERGPYRSHATNVAPSGGGIYLSVPR